MSSFPSWQRRDGLSPSAEGASNRTGIAVTQGTTLVFPYRAGMSISCDHEIFFIFISYQYFTALPILTPGEKGAEQNLCPHLVYLHSKNMWTEGSAFLTIPQVPFKLSTAEEGDFYFSAQQSKTRAQTSSLQAETGTEFIG